ncbi:ferritin-like domain-containing protein [Nisaea acidiphila]|uniref:Ferritin-like domain-containing protein n=1 Tax=Nisaea acidiphila TaxID=1862145 RepID=A0A9J7AWN9_9PROT|nr:ferritin-like domain-containing protein [Nisaea acidiphila]UUX50857.1 ferritin-like domain-containing protein [Nisaea acidiphila]
MPDVKELKSLADAAVAVLQTGDTREKATLGRAVVALWNEGGFGEIGTAAPPDRPARPELPALRPPREVPKRKITAAPEGRIALLHALAHIELNAIDLSWDMIARYTGHDLPEGFFIDWMKVADDESKHFLMISDRLEDLGSYYGALNAHDGLWLAATETAHDLLARLSIVPLVLEARGLDVTPAMIEKMREVGDDPSADILQVIFDDEITHVAVGKRWFDHVCDREGKPRVETWQHLVRTHFRGGVKPPFNIPARELAGFAAAFYVPLGEEYLAKQNGGNSA